ncbi:FmdB family zinc ribbon protein [Streptomyces sp. DH10]|uniref:FmdB family zinc ribbon protein n=1 Tax=Streptomyces sp. DH10 TaxID=3040121 RepID=UPI0024425410|nr:zinc ribbon domain-containing protein [Streptomyces sp. DH10]MDG9707176.1 zinc ribbon domain-containing protein [Streptomyces sp. DH10]
MATYQYRCPGCGSFDVARPIGRALPEEPCETCGDPARRVFTAPLLTRTSAALARALRAQEASAHEPRVVTEVPAARRGPAPPADPRHALLPKL